MTKAQEVYERVEALVADGARKADAFRQLAEEYGQPQNSIRGAYYAHTRPDGSRSGGSPSSRDPIDPDHHTTHRARHVEIKHIHLIGSKTEKSSRIIREKPFLVM